MNRHARSPWSFLFLLVLLPFPTATAFENDVAPLLDATCNICHTNTAIAPLDLRTVGYDLDDPDTYRTWVDIYDRVVNGEMPPQGIPLPEDEVVDAALTSLKNALIDANLASREGQRVPLRRLTRLEYAYTLHDLLGVAERKSLTLSKSLPAEADSIGFDTVAANQGISPLHIRSYLSVADDVLDSVLALGPRPPTKTHKIDYSKSGYLAFAADFEYLGFGIIKPLHDAYVAFFDTGSTYMFHSGTEGYAVPYPGQYRVSIDAYPYQPKSPVTLTVYLGRAAGTAASLDELIGSFDLTAPRTVEITTYLKPGDLIAPSVADLRRPPGPFVNYFAPDKKVTNYKGEGIALKSLTFEGPLFESWPPPATQRLLTGLSFSDDGQVQLTKDPYEHIVDIVAEFAPRAFRRPVSDEEAKVYADLALPLLDNGRPFLEAVRVPLRAILSAPPFLFHSTASGDRDDFALATRLSYFLWRSMPDDELTELAGQGKLSDPQVLAAQVDRMLDDSKSQRFIKDFVGQAFRLYELSLTTPDKGLYPEYDDRLGQAMRQETELFIATLVAENRSADHLIDSDFTFVNRRLAEHYRIEDVDGQYMRRVSIPEDSPRGGLLTQASIHKVTANGTVTSPVPRGNFVLNNILGKPVPPPPAGVAGLEPDIRGTTTIREQLTAHRSDTVCAGCHMAIDPPGFALESFDPIGGFRTRYRQAGEEIVFEDSKFPGPYRLGLAVDPSGVTTAGDAFAGMQEYKGVLLKEIEQIARHLVSQYLVFATGAEIEFADREAVDLLVAKLRDRNYPIRTMIHEVVSSDLFASR